MGGSTAFPIPLLYVGYSWHIHGVFTGYSYVSVMYRLCVGYVSVMYRNIMRAKGNRKRQPRQLGRQLKTIKQELEETTIIKN